MLSVIKLLKRFGALVSASLAPIILPLSLNRPKIYAVVGGKGKTTVCHLLAGIFQDTGKDFGLITSQAIYSQGDYRSNLEINLQCPSPWKLRRLIRSMVRDGVEDLIIEVEEEAVLRRAYRGLQISALIFINSVGLTRDGIDKLIMAVDMLSRNRPHINVVNIDDSIAEKIIKMPAEKVVTYGINQPAEITAKKIFGQSTGTDCVLLYNKKQSPLNLNLPGSFNLGNALAAASLMVGLGFPVEAVTHGLNQIEAVPGRMEIVDSDQPFTVIIDSARSPDDLQRVYSEIRPTARRRLICVLGSSDSADRSRRALLGSLAGRYCDLVYLTNEDSIVEEPDTIISQIAEGVPRGRPKRGRMKVKADNSITLKYRDTGEDVWWWRINDRKEAILTAIKSARPQDVVIITGKGADNYQYVSGDLVDWDDRTVVLEYIGGQRSDKVS